MWRSPGSTILFLDFAGVIFFVHGSDMNFIGPLAL